MTTRPGRHAGVTAATGGQKARRSTARLALTWAALAAVFPASLARAQVPSDSVVLEGDFIRTGVSNNGTLGVGGNISPGFIFDSTGTRTFNTSNDYLTPGLPHEGFSLRHDSSSVYINNNTGVTQIGPTSAPTLTTPAASGFDNSATWSGSVSGEFSVQHDYGLDDDLKRVEITTTITALTDLTDIRFARWIDPDSGGTSSINTRGNATLGLAPEDWVNSESETNGATLGLYSADDVTHNTGIAPTWSTDPDFYIAGTGDTTGDHTIGLGFDVGDLLNGESIVLVYYYAVGASADDFDLGSTYASRAVTPNQLGVATYFDDLGSGAPADLATALSTLSALTDPEFQAALDQLSGALYGSIAMAKLQHTSYAMSKMASQFRGDMSPGSALNESMQADAGQATPAILLAACEAPACVVRGQSPSCGCQSARAWISGYGLGGQAYNDGNADGFGYQLGGTQYVVERAIASNWNAGVWGDLAWGSVDAQSLSERADLQSYHFGGSLVGFDGCDYWIALAGMGFDDADVRRTITAGSLGATTGDLDGWQANTYLERGRVFCVRGWRVQPYAAMQYVHLRQNQVVESGAAALNLSVGGLDADSLRSMLGGSLSTTYATAGGRLWTPELRASWQHEFLDTNQLLSSSLPGTTTAFAVRGLDLGRDWALLGGGLKLQLNRSAKLFAGYDVQVNERQALHVGSGGLELVWQAAAPTGHFALRVARGDRLAHHRLVERR